jgi:EF hand
LDAQIFGFVGEINFQLYRRISINRIQKGKTQKTIASDYPALSVKPSTKDPIMKSRTISPEISFVMTSNQLGASNPHIGGSVSLPLKLAVALGIGLGVLSPSLWAENTGTVDIQHYKEAGAPDNTTGKATQNRKRPNDRAAKKMKQGEQSSSLGAKSMEEKAPTTTPSAAIEVNDDKKQPHGDQNMNADKQAQQAPVAKKTMAKSPSSQDDQNTQAGQKMEAVSKPADGKGKLPLFAQADVNGDHYITKDELQNFPYLLQVFDKVDAGNDGKLEQHEYQNLEMETKREGEIN